MGRKRKVIDETKIFDLCKDGATVMGILEAFNGAFDSETLRRRLKEYVAAGKLIWTKPGSRGVAGILKTV